MDSSPSIARPEVAPGDAAAPERLFTVHEAELARQRLPRLARQLALLLGRVQDLPESCRRLDLPLERGRAVVARLVTLGVVSGSAAEPAPPPSTSNRADSRPASAGDPSQAAAAAREPSFDTLEEAFFSSEVAPIDQCDEPFETVGQRLWRWVTRRRGTAR